MSTVLVTGANGFVGLHIVLRLLSAGYVVRGTVRSEARAKEVRAVVGQCTSADAQKRLTLAIARLDDDAGWARAMTGCTYVMHVASPFPSATPRHEDDIIRPARDGTLRVLRSATKAGVQRVVMTSSFAAIGYGHPHRRQPFTEADWTDVTAPGVAPYIKSKALAERAAWDFVAENGSSPEFAVINPTGIFGPVLGSHLSASVRIIKRMLDGEMPRSLPLAFGVVDVRDVADLHLAAMTSPRAIGQRYIAVSGEPVSMLDVARFLRDHFGVAAGKAPQAEVPRWILRIMAIWRPELRRMLPDLGMVRRSSHEKARHDLDWEPRSAEEAIVATGHSLLQLERQSRDMDAFAI